MAREESRDGHGRGRRWGEERCCGIGRLGMTTGKREETGEGEKKEKRGKKKKKKRREDKGESPGT